MGSEVDLDVITKEEVIIDIVDSNCINVSEKEENILNLYFRDFLMSSHLLGMRKAEFNTDDIPELASKGLAGFIVEIIPHKRKENSTSDREKTLSIYELDGLDIVSAWEIRCKRHSELSSLVAFFTEDA